MWQQMPHCVESGEVMVMKRGFLQMSNSCPNSRLPTSPQKMHV